jgi:enoyl-CoA hydratase/carnithine racemase
MIEIHTDSRVRRLTLNRPEKRNALNLSLCRALIQGIETADADPAVSAILLTANGKAFCAGMDLSEAGTVDRTELNAVHERLFTIGTRLRKPLIAAVHGAALAGGTGLVANAHIVIADEQAIFGLTEIRIALFPILIFRSVKAAMGERRTTELSLTGRTFTAQQAKDYGLIHEIAPDPQTRANDIATHLAELDQVAIAHGLNYINETRDKSWEEAGAIGHRIRNEALQNPAFQKAIDAFKK